MKLSSLEKAILETITFHSIFKIPLTNEEIFYFLYGKKTNIQDCQLAVDSLVKKNILSKKDNLYFLPGEEKILAEREKRVELSQERFQKVKKIMAKLNWLPFLKMAAVSSSLSFDNTVFASDIDLLIVAKKNRLWLVRFLLIPFLDMIGENKNYKRKANKLCLGFWFDESNLDLAKILSHPNDPYAYYWFIRLRPIIDDDTYQKFQKEDVWLKQYLPNWKNTYGRKIFTSHKIALKENSLKIFLENIFSGSLGNGLEKLAKKIQIWRLWRVPDNCKKKKWVIAKNSILKLPPADNCEYQKTYTKKLARVTKRLS